jgi:hopanoid C-2 methylase
VDTLANEAECARKSKPNTFDESCTYSPTYAPAFGTFSHAFRMVGANAFMPPQGLLLIANYLPESWSVRFVDENMKRATNSDYKWADAVFVTGMHIQASEIHDVCSGRRRMAR